MDRRATNRMVKAGVWLATGMLLAGLMFILGRQSMMSPLRSVEAEAQQARDAAERAEAFGREYQYQIGELHRQLDAQAAQNQDEITPREAWTPVYRQHDRPVRWSIDEGMMIDALEHSQKQPRVRQLQGLDDPRFPARSGELLFPPEHQSPRFRP